MNIADHELYDSSVLDSPVSARDAWVHGGFWQSAIAIFKELKFVSLLLLLSYLFSTAMCSLNT